MSEEFRVAYVNTETMQKIQKNMKSLIRQLDLAHTWVAMNTDEETYKEFNLYVLEEDEDECPSCGAAPYWCECARIEGEEE